MAERPILKLKLPKANAATGEPTVPPTGKKLKIKFGGQVKEEAAAPSIPAADDAPRPSPKIVFKSKTSNEQPVSRAGTKREHDHDGGRGAIEPPSTGPKRIKLTSKFGGGGGGGKAVQTPAKTPTTPFIKLKAKGRPPVKPMGIGYDSEASDAEEDPHIEEEFILRMLPGDDCEYVRRAIEHRTFGMPIKDGGADIKLKFLRHDGRRAVLIVRGTMYAASMVDLPCIIEGMKSWDKKGWWKTADICQMLLVLGKVKSEEEALSYPLPEGDVRKNSFMYEHGLTPPMKWARKRRFRKRISTSIVMQVEQEVDDLFRRDAEAVSSSYKLQSIDEASSARRDDSEDYFQEDAPGEIDEDVQYEGMMMQEDGAVDEEEEEADDWGALMEEAEEEQASQAATPVPYIEALPAATDSDAATPAVNAIINAQDQAETPAAQDGDESGSDADEDDADEEEQGEDDDEAALEIQRKREEIADIESAIAQKVEAMQKMNNAILRNKMAGQIKSLQEDLALKKAAIGEGEDDE